ncbi:MAG TPA: hypothetical protein VER11_20880 [Polyangiaceae bacterium]|nr:hypothetical protein [Polyangiaceae bacterium]
MKQLGMRGSFSALVALTVGLALNACASVSSPVKNLVQLQADKADQTVKDADKLLDDAKAKAEAFNDALTALDEAMQAVQAEEAKYALVFSANQNLESKSGVDATAAAYLIAQIYLAEQAGLSGNVKQQFSESGSALQEIARNWKASWLGIQKTQKLLHDYSEKSAVSAIDADFVAAVASQVPGSNERVDAILSRMKELRKVLDQASDSALGKGKAVAQTRSATGELVDLLDAISKSKPTK